MQRRCRDWEKRGKGEGAGKVQVKRKKSGLRKSSKSWKDCGKAWKDGRLKVCKVALWYRLNRNLDVSTGPLARPFNCSLV